ncbi:MAG: bacillithiol system redox-active protein YtxJ [Balneolaceae bacterium]|nr:bacillithiol system redox-active protein YtxJ [Balneolaceae bacterium]
MGLFDLLAGIFGDGDTDTSFNWGLINSVEQVKDILAASESRPQVIFKHSSRCATSFFARNDLETFPEEEKPNLDFHLVDVICNRGESMFIAERLAVRHESPQVFVLYKGRVIWNGSHHRVQSQNVIEAIREL